MTDSRPFSKQQTDNHERDPQVAGLKVPPHSIEAEQSVLSDLVLDSERWDDVAKRVVADDFYTHPHRHAFAEMARLQESGSPIDLITLAESLERQGQLNSVGDFACLAELSKNTPSAANISAYADIVRKRAVIRRMISVANEIIEAGFDPQGCTSEDPLDLAKSHAFKITESRASKDKGPKNIADVLDAIVTRIERLFQQSHDGVTGINIGCNNLSEKTADLQPSDLIIAAARPSMGKTTFAIDLVENAAMLQDKPVLTLSLEMPSEQVTMRSPASLSRVDQTKIHTRQLGDENWTRISGTMGILLEKRNIYIDGSSGLTPAEMRSRTRRTVREHGDTGLIMIDYLQLMHVPALSDSRALEITKISRLLKALTKGLSIPMVALSQLNRSLGQHTDRRPINSDLRESDSIKQDTDLIIFIYRDEVYHEDNNLKGIAEIIIGKQRNGPIGTVCLAFSDQWPRFDNYAGPQYDDE